MPALLLAALFLIPFRCRTCNCRFYRFQHRWAKIGVPAVLVGVLALAIFGALNAHWPRTHNTTARVSFERMAVRRGEEVVVHIDQVPKGWSGDITVNDSHRFAIHSKLYRLRVTRENGFNRIKPNDVSIDLRDATGDHIPVANLGQFQITTIPSRVSVSPESASFSDEKNSGAIQVTAERGYKWSVTGTPGWLKIISGDHGTGPGDIVYEVEPNMSNEPRAAALSIGDKIFDLSQRHPSMIMMPYQENFSSSIPPVPVWEVSAHKGAMPADSGIRWILDEQPGQRSIEKVEAEGPGGSPSLVVDRKQVDPRAWATQIYLPSINLREGRKYRVSLLMKAQNRSEVLVALGQSSPPYRNCGLSQTVLVPNLWTEFTLPFQISADNCGAANNRFSIELGKVAGKLWIAKISFSESLLSISPVTQILLASGGSGEIRVTSPRGTSWAVGGEPDWIEIKAGKTGTGNGVVRYTALENTSNEHRSATIHIADAIFHVDQPRSAYINVPFLESFSPPPAPSTLQMQDVHSAAAPPNRWVLLDLASQKTNVTVTAEGPQGGNSVVLDKPQPDKEAWTTQFYFPGLSATAGADYRVSMWMKAQHPGLVWLGLGQRTEPYHSCGLFEHIWVSGVWAEYKLKFRPGGEHCGPENNRLAFLVGGISGKLWLAKLAIDKESLSVEMAATQRK